jgi:succinate-semialdehyde dehydrogenase/glutarate-semialdehyde dehydrogenase
MVTRVQEPLTISAESSDIEVMNPVSGEVIARVANNSVHAVAAAAARARAQQPKWAATPVRERCRLIRRFGDLLIANQEHLIKTIRAENGKARGGAHGEVIYIASIADYYSKHGTKWLRPERRRPIMKFLYSAEVHHNPLGDVGNISPWNYPLVMTFLDMIPALVAGNAVIATPSEITPLSAIEGAKMLHEAGVPEDIFQVVTGDGNTGATLIDHVDFIQFTGSTAVGRTVAVRAAERLIPYSLELGGNDPMIVLNDADIDKAAASAVVNGFENSGQLCMSVERVIVEESIYEEFLQAAQNWQSRLHVGHQDDLDTHMGSITNRNELERTQRHIRDALDKGARLIAGGNPLHDLGPCFHEATILADVTPDMAVMQEETFGPVIAVTRAANEDEAVRLANATNYGLSASVWSRDKRRAKRVGLRIESGDVNVNTAIVGFATPSVEFGGEKESGVGRRNGKQGLLKYTSTMSVIVDNFPQRPEAPTLYTRRNVGMLALSRKIQKFLPFLGP